MADPKTPQNDKSKKNRSFGSFALIILLLMGALLIFGGQRQLFAPQEQLTQSRYEYLLYTGQIVNQEIGATEIEGELAGSDKRRFTARFGDLPKMAEKYREIQAIRPTQAVRPEGFELAVREGWYTPLSARLVTASGEVASETPPSDARDGKAGVQQQRISAAPIQSRLFVEVAMKPMASWSAKNPGVEAAFYLPEKSVSQWIEVQEIADLGAMYSVLKAAGTPVENLTFNVSKDKGTSGKPEASMFVTALVYLLPWVLILVVFFVIMRQMRNQGAAGGVMNFGRSRAQLYSKENHTNVTFDDVAGADEAKEEVKEIVEFLKNPGRFTRVGGRIPRGVLLVGSPGCGKTLLAKAIAGEAEVPFFSISGSDFVEMFVGVGASRVRDLFKQARENSPCIIFLDEIDAVGRRRGSGMGGGHDEREQTLNAILVEMDGFGTDEGIIVIAATNRPDVLDPALLRPGRFDREVTIDLPDVKGRADILRVHLKKVKVGGDVDVDALARSTPGSSGAQLAAIINEAAIMAALQKKDEVTMEHLEEARDKVRYGRQKRSRQIEEADRKITAIHEAGHAVVAASIAEVDDPTKVTIVPRGRALGVTFMVPEKESYHMQKKKMVGQLAVAFGGRVAEAEFVGDVSAGAYDDIRRATEMARTMVTELGMSDKVGPIHYGERQGSEFLGTELMAAKWHSEETAREIDQEVQRFLREAYERSTQLVREHRGAVERIAEALLRYETITGEDIRRILGGASIDSLKLGGGGGEKRVAATGGSERSVPSASPKITPGDMTGQAGLSPA